MSATDMSRAVAELVSSLERDNPEVGIAARVRSAWEKIADAGMDAHVVSVYVVPHTAGGEVVVYVDSALHVADLAMQADMLRLKLNIELDGEVQVEKLTFRLSRDSYRKQGPREAAGDDVKAMRRAELAIETIPLTDEEEAELAEAAGGITDERLARAALEAARANLEWQRGLEAAEEGD